MTLVQLRYLTAVDRLRHFGRAAADCGVAQPTLSMQLQKLERELGVELFDRSKSPVQPTDVGRLVIAQAKRTLAEAARIAQVIDETDGEVHGELRVGILPTLAPSLLPGLVPDGSSAHPSLTLRVEELQTGEVLGRIERETLDVGVIATSVGRPGLIEQILFEEPFVGYVSERHRLYDRETIRASELVLDELWLLKEGHCFRDQVLSLCQGPGGDHEPEGHLHFETANLETLKRLVDRSGGMTLLPSLAVAEMPLEDRRHVRVFEPPAPSRLVRIVHAYTFLKRGAVAALAAELRRLVPAELHREGTA